MSAAVRTFSASQEISFSNEMENLGPDDHKIKASAAAAAGEEAEKDHEEDNAAEEKSEGSEEENNG